MTEYGFYDNDIMDEPIVCDMIYGVDACKNGLSWTQAYHMNRRDCYGDYSQVVSELLYKEELFF